MRIGQVSFRLAGTDGVSLETAKHTHVLERMGHTSYYCAGELGPPQGSDCQLEARIDGALLIPQTHFSHPEAVWITDHAFGTLTRHPDLEQKLLTLSEGIKIGLLDFIQRFRIDVLVAQNILAIPMNLALSLAFYQVIKQTGIPTIAHHHDFYWERESYRVNCVGELLQQLFPPDLPNLRHVVINTMAQQQLAKRSIESEVIPNILDFEAPLPDFDEYNHDMRKEIGLQEDDLMFLQPTRVVPRKGIEHSIELISRLEDPRIKLIIPHRAEYNTFRYLEELCVLAAKSHVPLFYLPAKFHPVRMKGPGDTRIYSLWDAYLFADFVTYPSLYEGFGNALLETIYFRKPFLINRYQVFIQDIEPTGIKAVKMDGEVSKTVVDEVKSLLNDCQKQDQYADANIKIGKGSYSYQTAAEKLNRILNSL